MATGVLAQLVERLHGMQEVRSSNLLCSTKYAENQQVTEVIHSFVHSFDELCIFSFIVPHYTQTAPGARSEVDKNLPLPRIFRETSTPYVRPDTKKSCPLRRRQENFLALGPETWKED